jgi:hypothetical protein
MHRWFVRDGRSGLCLWLMICCCAAAFSQNPPSTPRRGSRAPWRSNSASDGNSPVAVSPGDWSQVAKFAESKFYEGCCSEFGTGVAISGDTIVVSDPESLTSAVGFVFVGPASGWKDATPVAALAIPQPGSGSSPVTGGAVAIAEDTIVIGPYVFVKPAGGWANMNPTATLSASDGSAIGSAVAISGDVIVETDPYVNTDAGAAYVFVKPAGGWKNMTQTAMLSASPQTYRFLGWSASISESTIALGTYEYAAPGAVYVFVKPSGGWANMTQSAVLTGSDGPSALGSSIAISGDEVLAGSTPIIGEVQSAYLFVKPAGGWVSATETAKLSGADPDQYAEFGSAVAIDGEVAVVGAPGFSRGRFLWEGGVYIFTEPTGGWRNASSNVVVTGSDARHIAFFGSAVALQGKALAVGAPPYYFHAAYVFTAP